MGDNIVVVRGLHWGLQLCVTSISWGTRSNTAYVLRCNRLHFWRRRCCINPWPSVALVTNIISRCELCCDHVVAVMNTDIMRMFALMVYYYDRNSSCGIIQVITDMDDVVDNYGWRIFQRFCCFSRLNNLWFRYHYHWYGIGYHPYSFSNVLCETTKSRLKVSASMVTTMLPRVGGCCYPDSSMNRRMTVSYACARARRAFYVCRHIDESVVSWRDLLYHCSPYHVKWRWWVIILQ